MIIFARFSIVALSLALFSVACATGPSTPSSSSSTEVKYRRSGLEAIILSVTPIGDGGAVELELQNGTSRLIGANMCRITVEHLATDGESWVPVELELSRDCVDEDDSIGPGGSRKAVYTLASKEDRFPSGELRFSMNVEYPIGVEFNKISSQPLELTASSSIEEPEGQGEESTPVVEEPDEHQEGEEEPAEQEE